MGLWRGIPYKIKLANENSQNVKNTFELHYIDKSDCIIYVAIFEKQNGNLSV
jgi:hypothetical protein